MKHTLMITIILIVVFLFSQLLGLGLINKDATPIINEEGNIEVEHTSTVIGERPETTGYESFILIFVGVMIGTGILLLLVKFRQFKIWKIWFFLAIVIAVSIALGVIMPHLLAFILSLIIAYFKVFRPNFILHNITEILTYAGIAVLIVPIFNFIWVLILLIVISIYDIIAVWQSKHMIKMAKFQTQSKVFAGLMIPYQLPKKGEKVGFKVVEKAKKDSKKSEGKTAILGGGDIAFPLLFTGVIMESLIRDGVSKLLAFEYTMIVTLFATTALSLLFFFSKKDRFYPAMPFLTAGCLVGFFLMKAVIML